MLRESVAWFLQRAWQLILLLLINGLGRVLDVVVLVPRPRLLWAYFRLVAWHIWRSPYRDFDSDRATGMELTFGETPVFTGIALFRRAGVGPDSLVVDLGAGRGRALLAGRWLGAGARGIELVAEHVRCAGRALAAAGARLEVGNATSVDLDDATHILLTWTVYEPATRARIAERLACCAPGTRVLAVDAPIEREGFATVATTHGLFTWGRAPVWIQEVL